MGQWEQQQGSHSCPSSHGAPSQVLSRLAFCHRSGDVALAVSIFQILTLRRPLPHEADGAGFLFLCSAACLPPSWLGARFSLYFGTSLCCNYVQRTCLAPGRGGGGGSNFCPLVLLPQCSYRVYLRGHALEQGLSPSSLHTNLALPIHAPSSVFSGFCFVSPATPAFHLFPSNPPPAPLWARGHPLSYRGGTQCLHSLLSLLPPHAAL